MANLIAKMIFWGILFPMAGTLGDMTAQMMGLAAKSNQSGLISLTKLNSALTHH